LSFGGRPADLLGKLRYEQGLATYGFVLEQDLTAVDWELAVPAELVPAMYPLSDIGDMTGLEVDAALLAADQYDAVRGGELALRARVPRRRRRASWAVPGG